MATRERNEVVGAQGGLGAAVAVETGGELGEVQEIKARGYWEQVWIRFKRDKVAIASGVIVIFLIVVAFVGGPLAKHFLHHGPNDIFLQAGAAHPPLGLPASPWYHFTDDYGHKQFFILRGGREPGRDAVIPLPAAARVSP